MRGKSQNKWLEQRLARAYVLLLLVPEHANGSRVVSLFRQGHYDVRLVELAHGQPVAAAKSFWVELFDHNCDVSLDSCRRDELEEAAIAAEQLMSQARLLDWAATGGR
jgi:hypothetical protein